MVLMVKSINLDGLVHTSSFKISSVYETASFSALRTQFWKQFQSFYGYVFHLNTLKHFRINVNSCIYSLLLN